MENKLPKEFTKEMENLLGADFPSFLASYERKKAYGLRVNPLKNIEEMPFTLEPVAWAKEGYYANSEERPGKHPLHEAGAYYIQEPSAMAVVSLLNPKPGDVVLDLCAAPGGKSTQIAGRLGGQGFLVTNEIFTNRAKILSQNVERMGVSNVLVCNESPEKMATVFPVFFDGIVVDAPCSGEGMFRKNQVAIDEWTPENVMVCAHRQKKILEEADKMLKPGGVLVYSTCTFAVQEDEQMIAWFLANHPDYELEDWRQTEFGREVSLQDNMAGLQNGVPRWGRCEGIPESFNYSVLEGTLRLWPHKLRGEGHFAARLRKKGTLVPSVCYFTGSGENNSGKAGKKEKKNRQKNGTKGRDNQVNLKDAVALFEQWKEEWLQGEKQKYQGRFLLFGEELYLLSAYAPPLEGLKVMRPGLHLGTIKKNRFEPAHALSHTLEKKDVLQYQECSELDAVNYLKGQTIPCQLSFKGWILVGHKGCSLGWGKAQNGMIKNHFPKGLRWM